MGVGYGCGVRRRYDSMQWIVMCGYEWEDTESVQNVLTTYNEEGHMRGILNILYIVKLIYFIL